MAQEKPLLQRIYADECYAELCRAAGYKGITYRELAQVIETLGKRFGKGRVEAAGWNLVTFEGQLRANPKPLEHVSLRAEVRKYCWQLLGPPPEHPEYKHFQTTDPWVPPWAEQEPPPEAKPKRRSRRKRAS
jgi:hypothetical protein